ncbi:MAG TPA: CesT family type III secretion system chaperone [Burkholderiaceae bacterium]|nr:CesT family type III secretion system chaperone [Burkholderiaceae bacterium]
MNSKVHAGLSSYLLRNRIDADRREDGSTVLVFDRQYRVRCWPASNGDIVLESRVTELPEEAHQCDDMLKEAMECAAHRINNYPEALVISEDIRELSIQQRISVDTTADGFETLLEQFVNSLTSWRQRFVGN